MSCKRNGKIFNSSVYTCVICDEYLSEDEIPNKRRICSDCYYERNDDTDQWDDFEWMDDRHYTDQSCSNDHHVEEEEVPFSFGRHVYVKPYHHENDDEYSMFYSSCSHCGNSENRCCCDICDVCDMIQQCCQCN